MQRGKRRSASAKRQKRGGSRSRSTSRSTSRASGSTRRQDAIALLKADHRQVEEWFSQFENTNSSSRKQDLAQKICTALKAHTMIEEEIFYPAFLEATEDEEIHHEAEIEHDGAKKLIADIERAGPDDDYFDARISVLSEMVKHHVKEEESRNGMFGKARKSGMDLVALGEQLASRKAEVMGELSGDSRMIRGREGMVLSRGREGRMRETRMASGRQH
jgi:hemerythrin superfamily protein